MYLANAKCKKCGFVFEISKQKIEDDFISGRCPKCKSKDTYRMFTAIATDVCEGIAGNSKTGYSKGVTYHPSKFGKFKGKKI